jgi:hypothetical protein
MDQSTAREYCVRHVAQILHDTVALASGVSGPRDKLDWEHAEILVDDNVALVSEIVLGLPCDSDYEIFCVRFGQIVWESVRDLRKNLPRPPYGEIIHE